MTIPRLQRADVRRRFGDPDEQQGSANEPRVRSEGGARWNERWVYREHGGPQSGRIQRVVLWLRGDFVGIYRADEGGRLLAEDAGADGIPGASG